LIIICNINPIILFLHTAHTFGQITDEGPQVVGLLLLGFTDENNISQVIPHHTQETSTTVHLQGKTYGSQEHSHHDEQSLPNTSGNS
jgi:hypothetical protein